MAQTKKSPKKAAVKKPKNMDLRDLLVIKLQSLYDTEKELVKALPKMAAKASDPELKRAFKNHLEETKLHVERLAHAFEVLEEKPKKLPGDAIRGLIKDAQWVMANIKGKEALDANLIAAASYVEHYEMAGYMNAAAWAEELGLDHVAQLLSDTLAEEDAADDTLQNLADSKIDKRVLPQSTEE